MVRTAFVVFNGLENCNSTLKMSSAPLFIQNEVKLPMLYAKQKLYSPKTSKQGVICAY